jgi:phage-related minor tail protein
MASATFTLRAVDATRAAFASVQNSLTRLENQTKGIAKITKLAFGGEAVLGTLNMMKQRLDKVAMAGEEMGFDDEQIASAIRMEQAVEGILNFLTKIPIALAQVGIDIGSVFDPSKVKATGDIIRQFKFERSKKEIESITEETRKLQVEMSRMNMTEQELADTLLQDATKAFMAAVTAFEREPEKGFRLQKDALAILAQREQLLKQIGKAEEQANEKLDAARDSRRQAERELEGVGNRALTTEQELNLLYRDQASLVRFINSLKGNGVEVLKLETDAENKLKDVIEKIVALEKERRSFGMEFGATISQSFEDAILSGTKLREVLRALGQDLLRLIFREQVTKPMASGLGNFFADLFTGRASGGPVTGGTPYLVGEKGPELFMPASSGSIVPNNRLGSSGGGATGVTINYHIAAGVTRSELVPILETERKRLKAEIPDMVRRGGAYRAAFA